MDLESLAHPSLSTKAIAVSIFLGGSPLTGRGNLVHNNIGEISPDKHPRTTYTDIFNPNDQPEVVIIASSQRNDHYS